MLKKKGLKFGLVVFLTALSFLSSFSKPNQVSASNLGLFTAKYYKDSNSTPHWSGTPLISNKSSNIIDYDTKNSSKQFPMTSSWNPNQTHLFSAIYTGSINIPASSNVRFTLTTDDGAALSIDGNMLINKLFSQSPTTYTADFIVSSSFMHTLTIKYFDNQANQGRLAFSWEVLSGNGGGGASAPVVSLFNTYSSQSSTTPISSATVSQPITLKWTVTNLPVTSCKVERVGGTVQALNSYCALNSFSLLNTTAPTSAETYTYKLTAAKTGYSDAIAKITLNVTSTSPSPSPLPGSTVTFTVVDNSNRNTPLPNAKVTIRSPKYSILDGHFKDYWSDTSGKVTINKNDFGTNGANFNSSNWDLNVSHGGCQDRYAQFSIWPPPAQAQTISLICDRLPYFEATVTDSDISEQGVNSGTFTISRVGSLTNSIDVYFQLTGSATKAVDYTFLPDTNKRPDNYNYVEFPSGIRSKTVTVTPIDDAVDDNDETVVLALKYVKRSTDNASGVGNVNTEPVLLTISDNETDLQLLNYRLKGYVYIDNGIYEYYSLEKIPIENATLELYKNIDDLSNSINKIGTTSSDKDGYFMFDQGITQKISQSELLSGIYIKASANGYNNNTSNKIIDKNNNYFHIELTPKSTTKLLNSFVNPNESILPGQKINFQASLVNPPSSFSLKINSNINPKLKDLNGKELPLTYSKNKFITNNIISRFYETFIIPISTTQDNYSISVSILDEYNRVIFTNQIPISVEDAYNSKGFWVKVSGKVRDEGTFNPISNAIVSLVSCFLIECSYEPVALTNQNGEYSFNNQWSDRNIEKISLRVTAIGYEILTNRFVKVDKINDLNGSANYDVLLDKSTIHNSTILPPSNPPPNTAINADFCPITLEAINNDVPPDSIFDEYRASNGKYFGKIKTDFFVDDQKIFSKYIDEKICKDPDIKNHLNPSISNELISKFSFDITSYWQRIGTNKFIDKALSYFGNSYLISRDDLTNAYSTGQPKIITLNVTTRYPAIYFKGSLYTNGLNNQRINYNQLPGNKPKPEVKLLSKNTGREFKGSYDEVNGQIFGRVEMVHTNGEVEQDIFDLTIKTNDLQVKKTISLTIPSGQKYILIDLGNIEVSALAKKILIVDVLGLNDPLFDSLSNATVSLSVNGKTVRIKIKSDGTATFPIKLNKNYSVEVKSLGYYTVAINDIYNYTTDMAKWEDENIYHIYVALSPTCKKEIIVPNRTEGLNICFTGDKGVELSNNPVYQNTWENLGQEAIRYRQVTNQSNLAKNLRIIDGINYFNADFKPYDVQAISNLYTGLIEDEKINPTSGSTKEVVTDIFRHEETHRYNFLIENNSNLINNLLDLQQFISGYRNKFDYIKSNLTDKEQSIIFIKQKDSVYNQIIGGHPEDSYGESLSSLTSIISYKNHFRTGSDIPTPSPNGQPLNFINELNNLANQSTVSFNNLKDLYNLVMNNIIKDTNI